MTVNDFDIFVSVYEQMRFEPVLLVSGVVAGSGFRAVQVISVLFRSEISSSLG